ncbi:hypothetical protein GGH12_005537 [Coemansia sp. RSA 1822]|nr:hypothetical protein LPJ76_000898 [Coemansia sp. RSA 638]KAJ2544063.1 hypothetical protein GGF49_001572 [Coemansia sp. RSA 1853]KAJ2559138.1 hypothetical protein GGH12_005537 [Coemansia sp. RSA 1822]
MDRSVDAQTVPVRLFSRKSIRRRATVVDRQRPCSISRVDTPPPLNTSIHAIDTLFRQYRVTEPDGDDEDSECAGSSPTSLVPSARYSLESASTAADHENEDHIHVAHKCSNSTLSMPNTGAALLVDKASCRRLSCSSTDDSPAHLHQQEQLVAQLMNTLFPHPQPTAKPYHTYFVVATIDGTPAIPTHYTCPTAVCDLKFRLFAQLQAHWVEHPWNRRGVLVPVMAGGIRRLSFWQHKAVFVKSIVRGPRVAKHGTGAVDGHMGGMSDYGDIRLLGPCSYFVSPKIVPIEQLHMWETLRPSLNPQAQLKKDQKH